MTQQAKTTPASPGQQRDALLDAQRNANQDQPRNFKEDALADKVVSVAPDGTGPTPTDTFDPDADQALGSGNDSDSSDSRTDSRHDGQTGAVQGSDKPDDGKTGAP